GGREPRGGRRARLVSGRHVPHRARGAGERPCRERARHRSGGGGRARDARGTDLRADVGLPDRGRPRVAAGVKGRHVTKFLNFIDGAFVAGSGEAFENRFPTTGEVIGEVSAAGKAEVDAAVGAARAALAGPWGRMSVAERVGLLRKLADGINARFDEFLAAEIRDTGKPRSIASHIDIPRGAANFNVFADQILTASTETFEMATPDGAGALNYALRVPRGVIAVICPWNLPLLLMTWKVAPALACGNTVVVKPSEETPATATLLGEVMNAVGIPRGVYNVVHGQGPGAAGEFLTTHPDVDGITFTGETRTGEAIMRAA